MGGGAKGRPTDMFSTTGEKQPQSEDLAEIDYFSAKVHGFGGDLSGFKSDFLF